MKNGNKGEKEGNEKVTGQPLTNRPGRTQLSDQRSGHDVAPRLQFRYAGTDMTVHLEIILTSETSMPFPHLSLLGEYCS